MRQITNTIMMIKPDDFGYNEQTAADNEFQHRMEEESSLTVNAMAMLEFDKAVNRLEQAGIRVLVPETTPLPVKTPDAVFPNNWIITTQEGIVYIFPMFAPNRRAETLRYPDIEQYLTEQGFLIRNVVYVGRMTEDKYFLEGTGSLIIDRINLTAYAALSDRTHIDQVRNFCLFAGVEAFTFDTASRTGTPYYHTNVLMSVGRHTATVCTQAIAAADRKRFTDRLSATHTIIDLTPEQAEQHMCGNMLELANSDGDSVFVMSQKAFDAFTPQQRQVMEQYGDLLPLPIPTIEYVGGGSARCMMAEIFLPPLLKH